MDNLLRVIGTLDMASPSGISWTTTRYFSKYRPNISLNKVDYGEHKGIQEIKDCYIETMCLPILSIK